MKVPTYHKFGLTKARIDKSEIRDKKISDILTHHLTIGIGIAFGILIYILNYNAVKPSTIIQMVMQVFLFASMGVICVGIPAVLFKLAEMFYFKYVRGKSMEKQNIKKYYSERDEYDFWKIRTDYSFWRVLDGLSFEKEVINIFMHSGYELSEVAFPGENPSGRVLKFEDSYIYILFNTSKEIHDILIIDELLKLKAHNNFNMIKIFSHKGFSKKVFDYGKENNFGMYDINGIIKLVRTSILK